MSEIKYYATQDFVEEKIAEITTPEITVDSTVTEGSSNPVSSDAVIAYIEESILGGEW